MFDRRWNVVEAVMMAASVLWASSGGGVAKGDAISSPSGLGDALGNSNNIAPFDPRSPARTQQVYASSDFSSLKGPQYIDSIVFQSGQFGATLQNITINMSTTSKPVDGLSSVFADNTGSDAQTVYQGTLPIFSTQPIGNTGPAPFDVVINLQHPFLYDPSKGNLLVDITNPSPDKITFVNGGRPNFIAQEAMGDSTSRVLGYIGPSTPNNPYSVGDLSHGHPDTIGLVTQFVTGGPNPIPQPDIPAVVPEPSSLLVMSFAAVSALVWRSLWRSAV
jgi:hypothetical protein